MALERWTLNREDMKKYNLDPDPNPGICNVEPLPYNTFLLLTITWILFLEKVD